VSSKDLQSHLSRKHYGAFLLTDAVRPSLDVRITPAEGFRLDLDDRDVELPRIAVSVSAERLFDVLLELLRLLGPEVDVLLESSHGLSHGKCQRAYRSGIDLPILMSYLCEYEDLLLNDGCTGIVVLDVANGVEVQLDEHKLILIYAHDPRPFLSALVDLRIPAGPKMKFLLEAEHYHCTKQHYADQLEQLCLQIGAGEPVEAR